jgi:hypothetical protein
LSGLLVAASLCAYAHPVPAASPGDPQYLFVQVVGSGSLAGDRLVLNHVARQTIFFADRPRRIAGHLPTERFVALWNQGADSFRDNPPNASLAFVSIGIESAVVVELHDPVLDGDTLSFRIRVLKGAVPASFHDASLFIDAGGLMQLVAYGAAQVG